MIKIRESLLVCGSGGGEIRRDREIVERLFRIRGGAGV
jgi:hypothetical protein